MRFKNFQLPKKLICDERVTVDTYGKFIAEPFERGYGHTIGNSLRRILLSSLEGAAITSVKINNIMHEFSTIPNVVEDVMNIILNLKTIRFKLYKDSSEVIYLNASKKGKVTAKDIELNENVEILNSDTYICTLNGDTKLEMEIEVSKGRGYFPVEKARASFAGKDQPIGLILVDAVFSPVTKVSYEVESTRVGQSIDYDRLIMDIWTDGSVKPADALAYAAKILKDSMTIFINFEEEPLIEEEKKEKDKTNEVLENLLSLSVNIIELSVRSINCLNRARIKTIGDLIKQPEDKLLALKGLKKLPLNSSITRRRRRCRQDKCGRPRGVYRKFGLCRIHLREALMRGDVPGGRKASW